MATTATPDLDLDLVEDFLAAIQEVRDAREFERLTVGSGKRSWRDTMEMIETSLEVIQTRALTWDEPSALQQLKGRRALESLQTRYPELWEQVVMAEPVDA